ARRARLTFGRSRTAGGAGGTVKGHRVGNTETLTLPSPRRRGFIQRASGVFPEPGRGLASFKTFAAGFDDSVAKNDGIEEVFDICDGVFGQRAAEFVCKAPAVNGQNLNEVKLAGIVDVLHVDVEERVIDRVNCHYSSFAHLNHYEMLDHLIS